MGWQVTVPHLKDLIWTLKAAAMKSTHEFSDELHVGVWLSLFSSWLWHEGKSTLKTKANSKEAVVRQVAGREKQDLGLSLPGMSFKVWKQIAHTVSNGSWDSPRKAFRKTYFSFRKSLQLQQVLLCPPHLHGFHAIRAVITYFHRSLWSHLMSDNRNASVPWPLAREELPCSVVALAF